VNAMQEQFSTEREYRTVIGKRILTTRMWKSLSQQSLADKAGVTRNYVSAVERGAMSLDAGRLRYIAAALDMTLSALLAEPNEEGR
jgi:transcriptional regulator with XRE-family HTH domain